MIDISVKLDAGFLALMLILELRDDWFEWERSFRNCIFIKGLENVVDDEASDLMFLMLGTRPDIAYAVFVISRYAFNPTVDYITLFKFFFRYIKGIYNYNLIYRGILIKLKIIILDALF